MPEHEELGDPWIIADPKHIDAGGRLAFDRSDHELEELKQHVNKQKDALKRKILISTIPAIIGVCSFLTGPPELALYIAESLAILLPAAYLAMETSEYMSDNRRYNKKKSAHNSLAIIATQVREPEAHSGRMPLK